MTPGENTVVALLVEDNPGDAFLVEEYVSGNAQLDLELLQVGDVAGALECLKHRAVDVVLADLSLPDSDGLATFEQIFPECGDAAFLVLSGRKDEELARLAVRAGAQDYLVKDDIRAESLMRCITYALERREAKLRERVLERELADAKRLTAIGRVVTGVAHEMRNPLQIVRYTVEVLEGMLADAQDAKLARQLERVRTAVDRGGRIVNELLEYGRPPALDLATHSVPALVHEALESVRVAERAPELRLLTTLPDELPLVRIDQDRVHQVLVNLLTNALAQMPEGGLLQVRAAPLSANRVQLEVLDSGAGLPAGEVDVFEPFFTTRPQGRGTGLGLSISRMIIERHGAELTLANRQGGGACARLTLPTQPGLT